MNDHQREAATLPPPAETETNPFGAERPTNPQTPSSKPPPASFPMEAVEGAVDRAFARAAEKWRDLLFEERAALVAEFQTRIDQSNEVNRRLFRKLRDDVTATKIQQELQGTPTGKPENVRVLVVDDEDLIRLQLRRLFESRGMTVFDAPGPDQAMNILDLEPIDVVLTDIRMPKNGMRLHEYVCRAHPGCEVVIMTGGEESEAADVCLQNGAFYFLCKPFRPIDSVVLTVVRAAEHRKTRRAGPDR